MDQDDENAPKGAPPNRTIQIDALSDVQLVDHSQEGDSPEDAEGAPLISRAPPPLPPRKPASAPSGAGRVVGFVLVIAVTGGLGALGAQFLVPAAPAPPAAPPSASPTASSLEGSGAAATEPEIHDIHIDDEFVIHAADPDAGLAAVE